MADDSAQDLRRENERLRSEIDRLRRRATELERSRAELERRNASLEREKSALEKELLEFRCAPSPTAGTVSAKTAFAGVAYTPKARQQRVDHIKAVERNRFAVEGVEPDRLAV